VRKGDVIVNNEGGGWKQEYRSRVCVGSLALIKNAESRYHLMNKFNLSYQCRLIPMMIKKFEMVGTHTNGINTFECRAAGQCWTTRDT
jgi:hypothetical protein